MRPDFFENLSKRIFMIALAFVFLAGAFLYGAFAYRSDLPPIPQLKVVHGILFGRDADFAEHPRRHHLQPSRGQGSGVTVNNMPNDGALVFMAGFFDACRYVRTLGTLPVNSPSEMPFLTHCPCATIGPAACGSGRR